MAAIAPSHLSHRSSQIDQCSSCRPVLMVDWSCCTRFSSERVLEILLALLGRLILPAGVPTSYAHSDIAKLLSELRVSLVLGSGRHMCPVVETATRCTAFLRRRIQVTSRHTRLTVSFSEAACTEYQNSSARESRSESNLLVCPGYGAIDGGPAYGEQLCQVPLVVFTGCVEFVEVGFFLTVSFGVFSTPTHAGREFGMGERLLPRSPQHSRD